MEPARLFGSVIDVEAGDERAAFDHSAARGELSSDWYLWRADPEYFGYPD